MYDLIIDRKRHNMARKVKFTREEIIDAGFNCIRKNGREGFSARSIGAELGASSMVIFSHFKTIDELFQEVYQKAYNFYIDLIFNESFNEKRYKYKTMALTYLKFAQEEKNLFKILFMEKRDVEYERLPESKLNSSGRICILFLYNLMHLSIFFR